VAACSNGFWIETSRRALKNPLLGSLGSANVTEIHSRPCQLGDFFGSLLDLLFTGLGLAAMTWVVSGPQSAQRIAIFLVLSMGVGLGMALLTIPGQTTLQSRSAGELRGRVFSSQILINNLVAIPPMLLSGTLADLIGLQWVLMQMVVMVMTVGLINLLQTG
jgi:hypothetical protein